MNEQLLFDILLFDYSCWHLGGCLVTAFFLSVEEGFDLSYNSYLWDSFSGQ
jgi:hypothetical protein